MKDILYNIPSILNKFAYDKLEITNMYKDDKNNVDVILNKDFSMSINVTLETNESIILKTKALIKEADLKPNSKTYINKLCNDTEILQNILLLYNNYLITSFEKSRFSIEYVKKNNDIYIRMPDIDKSSHYGISLNNIHLETPDSAIVKIIDDLNIKNKFNILRAYNLHNREIKEYYEPTEE